MTPFSLSINNLFRRPSRSIVIIAVSALAAGLIFSSIVLLFSVRKSLEQGLERLGAEILVVPAGYESQAKRVLLAGEPSAFYMHHDALTRARTVPGVLQASPQLFIASTVLDCCNAPNVLLAGYDPDSDFTIKPWISATVPAPSGMEALDPVVTGGNLYYLAHDEVRFYGKQFRIGAALIRTGMGFLDSVLFMTMDTARRMVEESKTKSKQPVAVGRDQISSILIKVSKDHDIHSTAVSLEAALSGVKAIETGEFVTAVKKDAETAVIGVMTVGLMCWILMLALIALIFIMLVNERSREFGMLRAMGASQNHIFRLIITEALIMTVTGSIAGVAIAGTLLMSFKQMIIVAITNAPFQWPPLAALAGIGAVCILILTATGTAAALYPAYKTCRREPYDAICAMK